MPANGKLQLFRGTTAQNNAYLGSAGEITFDTTTNRVRSHNGTTTGGFQLALLTDIPAVPDLSPYARKNTAETFSSNVTVNGALSVGSGATITGALSVSTNLSVAGTLFAPTITAASGTVAVTGNLTVSGDVTSSSDVRLKSDIETIESALDLVSRMRGVRYTMAGQRRVGVIAQETLEVVPEVVNVDGEYMSVAYGNLVGVLIEAIKELKEKVEK